MNKSLSQILIERLKEDKLASLYLINYDSKTIRIDEWVDEFSGLLSPIKNHPDILKITKEEKENEYKVDSRSIKDLINFTSTRPLKLKKKFLFLYEAQDLSVIVSNKLLKLFEELGSDFCLFLLVRDDAPLLPTVLSRAVKLKLESSTDLGIEELHSSTATTPYEFADFLKEQKESDQEAEKEFIEKRIEKLLNSLKPGLQSYEALEALLLALKSYESAREYNNSKLSRLSFFFS